MSEMDIREIIETEATNLAPVLHAGASASLAASLTRTRGLQHERYPHLVPLTMRAEMREFLESNAMPHGWQVGGDSRAMGQLLLHQPDLNLEMRFLKERRRTYPSGVPVAGPNKARRGYWVNDPLDLALPESTPDDDLEMTQLLLLWDFFHPAVRDQFTLRLAHTLVPGVYGRAVPCDLIIDVEEGGSIFSHLKFPDSPEDHDLFVVEIEEAPDDARGS